MTFQAVADTRSMIRSLRVLNALQTHVPAGSNEVPKLTELGLPAETITDPFTGEPLHVKKTPQGWLVYSVGPNFQDDGGKLDDPAQRRRWRWPAASGCQARQERSGEEGGKRTIGRPIDGPLSSSLMIVSTASRWAASTATSMPAAVCFTVASPPVRTDAATIFFGRAGNDRQTSSVAGVGIDVPPRWCILSKTPLIRGSSDVTGRPLGCRISF